MRSLFLAVFILIFGTIGEIRTLDFQPACMPSPVMYFHFLMVLDTGNVDLINQFMKPCGFLGGGQKVEILEKGSVEGFGDWVKVKVDPLGPNEILVYMDPKGLYDTDKVNEE